MGIRNISSFKGRSIFLKIYGFLGVNFLFASVTLYIKVRYDLFLCMAGCCY